MSLNKPSELFELLKNEKHLFIQTHNFPDHDAVASAFALKHLLLSKGIESQIVYDGESREDTGQDSLKEMINSLHIPLSQAAEFELNHQNKILIVDGSKNNKNLTDLIGEEVAVIDHHEVERPDDVRYIDIRPDYGACSTILYSYYKELEMEIPQPVATALLIGLLVDTAQMTRGVSVHDVAAYAALYRLADNFFVNSILRNKIQLEDLAFYKHALNTVRIQNEIAFCYFPTGCNLTLLAIIGDFFLTLREVSFTCLCAKNERVINFSLRSEKTTWNAAKIVQRLLAGIGFGGGHHEMAGGIMHDVTLFDEIDTFRRLHQLLA